jgi:hypothetical protein
MTVLIPSWRPKKRNCYYGVKPDNIPEWVYTEAVTAKRYYNENWEFWVYQIAHQNNCSQAIAEDACIRGLKKSILMIYVVYGDSIGKWYEEFLDMKDIFDKVSHPIYLPELGYNKENKK